MQPSHWKFNPSINQTKQFPLYFAHPLTDTISKTLTAFGSTRPQRIVYMGPRHTTSTKLLKAYSADSKPTTEVPDSEIFGEEQISKYSYQTQERQKYYPVRASEYRLFVGMNPTAKRSQLQFDSNFQCGNLDLVVSVGERQYDLYMRVDSNTRGHTCWFCFKVSNYLDRQRVKLNITNFSRSELLYQSGMKVFTYCSSTKEWTQDGQNIQFYPTPHPKYIEESDLEEGKLHTLSFEYEFKIEDEFVYFAYCIPYSYSYLQLTLSEIQKKYFKIVDIDRANLSTGGLSIPLVTITNKNSNIINLETQVQTNKEVVLIIGRLHPGETQSSWILHGFINYLCSPKAKDLRNKAIFKIIPMVNVDGVVAGNFRTGLLGRDLNRFFSNPELLTEIGLIRSLAIMFKPLIFLDFHGHSSKKNNFAYGPDYSIDHKYFLPSRLLCKLISKCSQSFRYYACSFKLSAEKKNTGRAVMLKIHQVPYSFTFESSAFAYGMKREETLFDKYEYIEAGTQTCMGVERFMKAILALPKRLELLKQLQIEKLREVEKAVKSHKRITSQGDDQTIATDDKKIFQEIISDQKEPQRFDKDANGPQDSDFEEDNDYTEKQLQKMLKDPSEMPSFQNKKKHRKGNKNLLGLSIKQTRQIKSLSSQKSMKLEIAARLGDSEEQANHVHRRKPYYKKFIKQLTPDLDRNQSLSLHMNVESFPPVTDGNNISKIQIKLSKRIFSDDSCVILEDPLTKIKSLNQVSLDYSISRQKGDYEPLSEAKKMREKVKSMAKKMNKEQEKAPYNLCAPILKATKKDAVEIKYHILPMLGRSGNMNKEQSHSLLNEILENHERSISNRVGKNSKIFHY